VTGAGGAGKGSAARSKKAKGLPAGAGCLTAAGAAVDTGSGTVNLPPQAGKDLRTDDALELLRGRPEFRQIVKRFEAKGPAHSGGHN
jgi:hypothetical protein